MSDPLTNVEIEDVLSSIRRLVSNGDKARLQDQRAAETAPAQRPDALRRAPNTSAAAPSAARESGVKSDPAKPQKLVLTPALMVREGAEVTRAADHAEGGDAPILLTDMIWEAVEETLSDVAVDPIDDPAPHHNGRSALATSIAELEAAVSAGVDDYDLDDPEDLSEAMTWPKSPRPAAPIEDAQEAASVFAEDPNAPPAQPTPATDIYADDDLDELLETGRPTYDAATLREAVREIVREELTGPMGERITRNVRKLVQREIYRALSSRDMS